MYQWFLDPGNEGPTFRRNTMPSPSRSDNLGCLNVKKKAVWSFKMSETTHPATQHHIPEHLNLQPSQSVLQPVSQPWALPTFCPLSVRESTECNFVLKYTSHLFCIFNQHSGDHNVWRHKSSVMLLCCWVNVYRCFKGSQKKNFLTSGEQRKKYKK